MKSERIIKLKNQDEIVQLCGSYDKNIKEISKKFKVKIFLDNNDLIIRGKYKDVDKAYN